MFEESRSSYEEPARTSPLPLRHPARLKRIARADIAGESYDHQGIDWAALHARPCEAYEWRHYLLTGPLSTARCLQSTYLPGFQPFMRPLSPLQRFRFAELATTHVAGIPHNDLRNTLACPSVAASFYADHSTVYRAQPGVPEPTALLSVFDEKALRSPWIEHARKTAILTLAADRRVLAIGSFDGRYAYASMQACPGTPFTEGSFRRGPCHSINHIVPFPTNNLGPCAAALCSNADGVGRGHVGVLDFATNCMTLDTQLEYQPNAAGVSTEVQ